MSSGTSQAPLAESPEVPPAAAPTQPAAAATTPQPSRSQYYISRSEVLKGVANRFVFSQAYIYLYLTMAVLSLTTVVLSLMQDCPTSAFYVLETVINTAMITEVGVRLVAFGKQFWKSHYNTLDLAITIFCIVTLLVIFFSGCSAKNEEVFDTFLLVIRNIIQFGRLASVMRRSGKSVFRRPARIDLTAARDFSFSLDLDLDDEEALATERRADGGDPEAQRLRAERESQLGAGRKSGAKGGSGAQGQTQPFLLESDEEDDR